MAGNLLCFACVIRRLLVAMAAAAAVVAASVSPAAAEENAVASWTARYDRARAEMIEGHFREAQQAFEQLAVEAVDDSQRILAREMAKLCATYAERESAARAAAPRREVRTTDELTLLYASAFLYGAGTGTWFLLQVQPDSAVTATLPFAAMTAAPVVAVATVDGVKKLPRGLPHAISAGLYLGLGEGVWIVGYQQGRAARIEGTDPNSNYRWKPETSATVLWTSSTLGAVLGGIVGASVPTTPGRVSMTASTTMWAGAITGLGAGALMPDDDRRRERAFLAGGAGYNLGLLGGALAAGSVSPSVARVRLVDLLGIAGSLATAGLYLSLSRDPDTRTTEGLAAAGATGGLAIGWLVTAGMAKETPSGEVPAAPRPVARPSLQPVSGGFTLGLGGVL